MKKKILFASVVLLLPFIVNAQTWGTYGTGLGPSAYGAASIIKFNGNLIATGSFARAGGNPANNIAQWNGSSWSVLGAGLNQWGYGICIYNGNLYVGGAFDSAGGAPAKYVAAWNGSSWSPVGSGLGKTTTWYVRSMCVYNGQLIAGGEFDSAGGIPALNIAAWNGTSWSALGLGIQESSLAMVATLAVYNGELYAGGYFDSAGGARTSSIAKWNGTSWSPVGGGIRGQSGVWNTMVNSLCVYEGNLYAGGIFDTAGTVVAHNIAMWNGTTWSAVGGGITWPGVGQVYALTTNNSTLYAGGIFNRAGSDTANNVAQWNGAFWYPMGKGVNGTVYSLCINDSVVVASGGFNVAGGSTSCSDIAYWIGGPPSAISICYVTVDTASKYNEILWDKTGVDTNIIDSVRIYVKSFTSFKYLGSVSIHNFTQFIDTTSRPNTTNSTYEIATVDTAHVVSQLTTVSHQTILLQASIGVGNVVNLSWNPYIGDTVLYYVILRDSNGSGHWQRYDSVVNNVYAYTDNTPPVSPDVRYVINTVWNLSCVPYSNSPIVRHQIMNNNRVYSRSNRKILDIITAVPYLSSLPSVSVYPNPAKDVVTLVLSKPAEGIITLTDVIGQSIYSGKLSNVGNTTQLSISGLADGVYFYRVLNKRVGLIGEGKVVITH